jgi:hypothetical protein
MRCRIERVRQDSARREHLGGIVLNKEDRPRGG